MQHNNYIMTLATLSTYIFYQIATPVTILVGNKTLEDLEKEVEEAEKVAKEARLKAQFLKHEVEKAKRASGSNFDA